MRQTRTIALMNQKGGVGKTTTAVALAHAVALAGRRTLLIDLDPQAHASLHLGVERAPGSASVYDLLLDPGQGLSACVHAARPNLDVLAAETDLAAIETELAGATDRLTRLKTALAVESGYEFVFIDCPPSLGLLTLNGLAAAREVFVPTLAHFLAMQGMVKLLETVSLVRQTANPRLFVTGVVVCQHDNTTSHAKAVVEEMDQFFEAARGQDVPWRTARVYRPLVRRNIKLAECPSFGKSILEYAPWCPGAIDYRALAEVLVGEWDEFKKRQAGVAGAPGAEAAVGGVVKTPRRQGAAK